MAHAGAMQRFGNPPDWQHGQNVVGHTGMGAANPLWQRGSHAYGTSMPPPPAKRTKSIQRKHTNHRKILPFNFLTTPQKPNITANYAEQYVFKFDNEYNPLWNGLKEFFVTSYKRPPLLKIGKDGKRQTYGMGTNPNDPRMDMGDIYGPQQYKETILPMILPVLNWALAYWCANYDVDQQIRRLAQEKGLDPDNAEEMKKLYIPDAYKVGLPTLKEAFDLISPLGVCITQEDGPRLRSQGTPDVRNIMMTGETDIMNYWGCLNNGMPVDIPELTDLYFLIKVHDTMTNPEPGVSRFDLKGDGYSTWVYHVKDHASRRYTYRVEPWFPDAKDGIHIQRTPDRERDLATYVPDKELILYGAGWRIGKLSENQGSGLEYPLHFNVPEKNGILYSVSQCISLPKKGIKLDYMAPVILPVE